MPKLHIYKNEKETYEAFAEWFSRCVKDTLKDSDKFTLALWGDDVCKVFFKIFSGGFKSAVEWSKVHLFCGDERLVSFGGEKNNCNFISKTSSKNVGIPTEHIHLIPTNLSPQEAAGQYEDLLHKYFDTQATTFDLVILGLDEENNVSLFPGTDDRDRRYSWVVPVYNKIEDFYTITLTSNVINAAAAKAFLITGKEKQDIVHNVLKGKYEPEKYPVQLIQTVNKTVHWFLDESAAGKLIKPTP